jgi:predicted ATP-grasp superfamily ATP-dependent carboligase
MLNILLTGGRAPATLELARAIHKAGHTVFMAESLRGHLSQPSNSITKNFYVPPPRQQTSEFINALKTIIIENRISLLIPTCEETFYIAEWSDELPCAVLVETISKLNQLHNKWSFVINAIANDLYAPETMLIKTKDDLFHTYAQWRELVLKPTYSRFATRTLIRPPLKLALSTLKFDAAFPWVAQEYIHGRHYCTYSICHNGRITAHTTYPSTFRVGENATIVFQHVDHPAIFRWVKKFVEKNQFTGQIAFDFIEMPNGEIAALECNPRATSGVHLLASHPQFFEAFLNPELACITPIDDQSHMLSAAMLIYGLPAALKKNQFKPWLKTFLNSDDVILDFKDPLPALLQFRSILSNLFIAWKNKISPFEAATFDIEWNEEEKRP